MNFNAGEAVRKLKDVILQVSEKRRKLSERMSFLSVYEGNLTISPLHRSWANTDIVRFVTAAVPPANSI
jgi:hypothetical protein